MIVPLIPLFLAAFINPNENEVGVKDTWKYGSEAKYELRLESTSHPIGQPGNSTSFNRSTEITCRPKSISTLSCAFYGDNNRWISASGKHQKLEQGRDSDFFELNFRRDGLKELVVSKLINTDELDTLRAVMAQLNVGTYVYASGKNHFEAKEYFATGICRTYYDLSRRNIEGDETSDTDKPYDILMLMDSITVKNRVMEIKRRRNLDKCRHRVDFFLGSREARESETSGTDVKIKSSKSEMTIGMKDFKSWTENTIIVTDKLDSNAVIVTERITLTLVDIVPAAGPLPTFNGPTLTANIFPSRYLRLEDPASKESSSKEEKTEEVEQDSSEEKNDLN